MDIHTPARFTGKVMNVSNEPLQDALVESPQGHFKGWTSFTGELAIDLYRSPVLP